MCSRCGKRPAMFFITKVEGNETKQEGLCMKCAMEMNIGPIKQIMESMGISEDEVDSVSDQFDGVVRRGRNRLHARRRGNSSFHEPVRAGRR